MTLTYYRTMNSRLASYCQKEERNKKLNPAEKLLKIHITKVTRAYLSEGVCRLSTERSFV